MGLDAKLEQIEKLIRADDDEQEGTDSWAARRVGGGQRLLQARFEWHEAQKRLRFERERRRLRLRRLSLGLLGRG